MFLGKTIICHQRQAEYQGYDKIQEDGSTVDFYHITTPSNSPTVSLLMSKRDIFQNPSPPTFSP